MSALPRITDAASALAAAGLAPACLASGSNFYIQAWEGHGQHSLESLADYQDVGRMLAKIHSVPTQWFDKHRQQLISQMPALGRAPLGSHIWTCLHPACVGTLEHLTEEILQAFAEAPLVAPQNSVASRLVTCHLDLHYGNLLKTDHGLLCIDFESACVTHAASDLAAQMAFITVYPLPDGLPDGFSKLDMKKAFAKSYLQELGESCDDTDVEELIFEAELARACCLPWCQVLRPEALMSSPETAIKLLEAMQSFVSRARDSSSLRANLLEHGFTACAREDALYSLAEKTHHESQARIVEEVMKGIPFSTTASADEGDSLRSDHDSLGSSNMWELPLGFSDMALPFGFDDAGLDR
jgi:hypothetical protein